jgi:hypothetical protein
MVADDAIRVDLDIVRDAARGRPGAVNARLTIFVLSLMPPFDLSTATLFSIVTD